VTSADAQKVQQLEARMKKLYDDAFASAKGAVMALPKFFAVNDRPAKVVEQPDGGYDVMVLDMHTGEWERDISYL
jgi:hypothetical protein